VQPSKADCPMEVTEVGISTEARLVQYEKANLLMEVTEVPIFTDTRLVQPSKADCPMEVTEVGISTEARLVQPAKADCPMEVTEVGIFTDTRLVQLKKADCPMEGTPLGIATSPCVSGSIKQSASHPDTAKARQYKNTANAIDGHVGNAPRYIRRRCQATRMHGPTIQLDDDRCLLKKTQGSGRNDATREDSRRRRRS